MLEYFVTTAHAQEFTQAKAFVNKVFLNILDPIVLLMFGVAVMVFFWGLLKLINNTDNPTKKEEGKRTIIWGIVGMFIMVSAFGILRFIGRTIGQESVVNSHIQIR